MHRPVTFRLPHCGYAGATHATRRAGDRMLTLSELMEDHHRVLLAIDGNERQLLGPRPERFEALAAKRWALVRELLLHCARVEALVLRPLLADRRPHVAAQAARSLAEQALLLADFKEHVRRWGALAGEAQWGAYVGATRALMQRIRRHLQSEASDVYRYLPAQRDVPARRNDAAKPPTESASACAREIGKVIFRGRPLDRS